MRNFKFIIENSKQMEEYLFHVEKTCLNFNEYFHRYYPLVKKIAYNIYTKFFQIGLEYCDLLDTAGKSLCNSILEYNPYLNINFTCFLITRLKSDLYAQIRKYLKNSQISLNKAKFENWQENEYRQPLGKNPEREYINQIMYDHYYKIIQTEPSLNEKERKIILRRIGQSKMSRKEELKLKSKKEIVKEDNAYHRGRRKLLNLKI